MDEVTQIIWAAVVERLGLSAGHENGSVAWRGRIDGERLVIALDPRGDLTAISRGPAPETAALLAAPRSAFLSPDQAFVTGDPELDDAVAIVALDAWTLARLDAQTRRLLRTVVAAGGAVVAGEVRLGPMAPERWGDAAAIEVKLRSLAALAGRLNAPLPRPAAPLSALAASDPLAAVRARAQAALDEPERAVAVIEAAEADDDGLQRLTELARSARADDDRESALCRLLLLFGLARAREVVDDYPGPWTPRVRGALLGALHPGLPPALLDALARHPVVGEELRLWSIQRGAASADPEILAELVTAPDPEVRRGALDISLTRLTLAELGRVLPRSRGPFGVDDLRRLRDTIVGGEAGEAGRGFELVDHVSHHLDQPGVSEHVALARAFGATADPRARPPLAALAQGTLRQAPMPAIVASWACGAGFDELQTLKRDLAWPQEAPDLIAEVREQAPPRGGQLLAEALAHRDARDDRQQLTLLAAIEELADPTAVPTLLRFVSEGYFDAPLVRALGIIGETGELADVAALEPFTRGFFREPSVKAAASDAIGRITARCGRGGQSGGLSLADERGGDLALAEPADD